MEALDRLESAADAAEAAATRLQINTADPARDAAADEAKALAHGARGAAAGLREGLAAAAGADDDAAAAAAATAAVAAAAAAVDAELRDVAAELDAAGGADAGAGASGSGSAANAAGKQPALGRAPTFKSSARAVRELEALAARRGARSVRASSVAAAAWALWAALVVGIIRRFALGGPELHRALAWGAAWGFLATAFYFFNRKKKAERAQRLAMVPGAKGVQVRRWWLGVGFVSGAGCLGLECAVDSALQAPPNLRSLPALWTPMLAL
jgi:hypothetical protein